MKNLGKFQNNCIFCSYEEKAADVLEELEPHEQVHIIESLPLEKAADVLEKMPAKWSRWLLDELGLKKQKCFSTKMEHEFRRVRELLEYPWKISLEALMNTEVLSFSENITIDKY